MKGKTSKRILTLLCVASVLVVAIGIAFQTKAEKPLEHLDPTLKQITFSDYGWNEGTHSNMSDISVKYGHGESLAGKVFSGNVTFSANDARIYIGGGSKGIWSGLRLRSGVGEDALELRFGDGVYTLTSDIAGTKLTGKSFNLKISYQLEDSNTDGSNDTLKLGVWFNDKLYNNEFFRLSTYGNNGTYNDFLTGGLGIYSLTVSGGSSSLAIASDIPEVEVLDTALEQISFNNYGWDDRSFTSMPDISVKYGYGESLDGKVISGKVTFSGDNSRIYVGGGELGIWKGLRLMPGTGGSLKLTFGGKDYTFTSTVAGTTLINNPFNLKLSYQTIDSDEDGTNDTLKLGVWFNNKLYNNKYFMLSKYGDNRTYKDYLTGGLGFYAIGSSGLTIASDVIQTLDPSLEKITFSDYGWANGTYSNMADISTKYGYGETLNGKVISGTVTFSANDARIYIGGGDLGIWKGLRLMNGTDGNLKLRLGDDEYTLTPATAGVTLVENPLDLKLSYQVIDADENGTDDTLRLGVWFEDTLYNNEYFEVSTYGENRTYKDFLTGGFGIYAIGSSNLTIVSDVPEVLDPLLEEITFSNYGWDDGTYSNMTDISAKYGYTETLDGKVISGDITFSANDARLYIGGGDLGIWKGLRLKSGQTDGSLKLSFGGEEYTLTSEIAGVTLVDNPFNLKLSYQVLDTDADETKDTLRLGVWFNDKLYNNQYFELSTYGESRTYEDYLTGGFGIYALKLSEGTGSLTITSEKPEVLDSTLEHITFSDFGWLDGTYSNMADITVKYEYADSFAEKVISGDVSFSANNARIYIGGGAKGIWGGLNLSSGQEDGNLKFGFGGKSYTIYPSKAGTTLVENTFNLKISYQVIDKDNDGMKDTLKLGLWFNDKLYDNEYFYVSTYGDSGTYEDYLRGGMGIYAPLGLNGSGVVTISSEVFNVEFPEVLDPNLEQITFRDFGIENGRYTYTGDFSATGTYNGTLDGKVFSGDVTFSTKPVHLFIGGQPDAWYGISLATGQPGVSSQNLRLKIGGQTHILKPSIAGVTLVGETYNLKLSYQVIDLNNDGKKDTLQFGVWFNDKLYNNEYFYVSTYESTYKDYGTRTYEDYLDGRIALYAQVKGAALKVASDGAEVMSSKLQQITFSDFGIKDDTYSYVGDLAASGTYSGTLAGKVICGDVTFSSKPATLFVGGEPDVTHGISITSGTDGNLVLKLGDNEYVLTSDVAGTKLVEKALNLKLSYQVVDDDNDGKDETLQFGVWLNDKLYNNEYFYVSTYGVSGTYTDYLIGRMAIKPETQGAFIKLVSAKLEILDASLEKITFADFNISNGTYSKKGGFKIGFYSAGSLDGKVFSGDVTFSNLRSDIWIGGLESAWGGIGLLSGYQNDTTTLRLRAKGREYVFTPEIAGTTLVGEKFNLKLSYQMVDLNNDKTKDTLKLGVWFNNKLYNNQYIYIENYKDCIGGYMGIYTEKEGSFVTVASDLKIDNPALGSRRAPSPNTGDTENIVLYICVAVLAMVAIVVLRKRQHLD